MNVHIDEKMVLPLEFRQKPGLPDGADLVVIEGQGEIITTRRAILEKLRGSLARHDGRDMTQELLEECRAQAARKWL